MAVIVRHGSEFSNGGNRFRFIGANIRGLCHFGGADILPRSSAAMIDENINALAAMGVKVVRVYAANQYASAATCVGRLGTVLDKLDAKGMKAIVCLTDQHPTGFFPAGDNVYYLVQYNGQHVLDDTWYNGGYLINYVPWVELCVNTLKSKSGVFAWELGNELCRHDDPDAIIAFSADMAARIKAIDAYHMVTTGFLSLDDLKIGFSAAQALYEDDNIDFMTRHIYSGADDLHPMAYACDDVVWSRVQKPLVIEEFGWHSMYGDRVINTQAQVTKWFGLGARGFMQWGYQVQAYNFDDFDVWDYVGMNPYRYSDYTQLRAIYQAQAAVLAAVEALPSVLEPSGANAAIDAVGWAASGVYGLGFGGDKVYQGSVSLVSKYVSGAGSGHWLAIDLGANLSVNWVTLKFEGYLRDDVRFNVRSGSLEKATSLAGPWSAVQAFSNPGRMSVIHCLFSPSETIRCLRVNVTDTGQDQYARLLAVEVYI